MNTFDRLVVTFLVFIIVILLLSIGKTSARINQRMELRQRPEVIIYKDAVTGDSSMIWKSDSVVIHKY